MRSFAVAVEPIAAPRLAAFATLFHVAAAASPWLARVPALLAAALCVIATASLALTLARLPGRHCALAALRIDGRGCRVRLAGSTRWQLAELGVRSRAYTRLVVVDVRTGGRHCGWLLPRGAAPAAQFRRLKARIRLSC
jgi:hypothetical protein